MTVLEILIACGLGLIGILGRRAINKFDSSLEKMSERQNETNQILARMDERDAHREEAIATLRDRTHGHANVLQHHETRISILEDHRE